jgi:AraC-like DNA-binding protein
VASEVVGGLQRWTVHSAPGLMDLFPGGTFEPLTDGPFEAHVVRRILPRVVIEGVSADPYLVRRSSSEIEQVPRTGMLLNVVLEGEGDVLRAGRRFHVGGGEVFLLRPDRPFEYRCPVWTRTFRASVADDLLPLESRDDYEPPFAVLASTPVVRAFIRLAADLLDDDVAFEPDRTSAPHLDAALVALEQGVLAEDLAARARPVSGNDALRQAVLEHIERNLGDRDLGPRSVAEHFSVSLRTVHNLFEPLPETLAGRVRRRRVEEAAAVLRLRDATAGELADRFGFTSSDTFLRAFQRQQGVSPREYRALQEDIDACRPGVVGP